MARWQWALFSSKLTDPGAAAGGSPRHDVSRRGCPPWPPSSFCLLPRFPRWGCLVGCLAIVATWPRVLSRPHRCSASRGAVA